MQEWTALAKMVFRLKPLQRNNPPTNRICLSCYRAVHTKVCTSLAARASRCSLQAQMHFYRSGVRGEDMLHSAHCMTKQPVAYIVMLCLAFVKLIVQPKMAMPTPCDT